MAYQTFDTTCAYQLSKSMVSGEATMFAQDLCVGGTENTDDTEEGLDSAFDSARFYGGAVFACESMTIPYAKNIYNKVYPASTTKVLTCLLALKYGDLDQEVCVSSKAAAVPAGSSVAELMTGDTLTLRQLLYGLMLCSGNDAANAVAETVSGSNSAFVNLMNQEAQILGATHTHFTNPHGYPDDSHYTTVYDLYLIMNEALKYPEFRELIKTKSYDVTYYDSNGVAVTKTWENTNQFLNGIQNPPEHVTVLGGKTGSSDSSGFCLILYCKNEAGEDEIAVMMKNESKETLYPDMAAMLTEFSN